MNSDSPECAKLKDLECLWNPAAPQESEAIYRGLLPVAEELGGRERCQLIELYTYIARCEMAQGRLDEARSSLTTAERLLNEQGAAYKVSSRIKWLLEMGRLQIQEKTPSQARAFFAEAWTLSVNSGEDALAAEVTLLMASIEPQKQQQDWISRGIQIAEASPQTDAKRWLGVLYATLGWKLFDLRQLEPALAAMQKSLSFLKAIGSEREIFVAKWSVGKLLRALGRTDEALTIQSALLAELNVRSGKDGRVFQELAECLYFLKRLPEAQVYFDLAYRELSTDEWVVDNQPEVLKRLKELGKSK